MLSALNRFFSKWFVRYYLGPNHPAKLRIAHAFLEMTGYRVVVPYAKNGWISLDLTNGLEQTILYRGHYEPEVSNCLISDLNSDDVVWDIGANIGGVGLKVALERRAKEVHFFEPHPGTAKILSINLALNSELRAFVHPVALGETSGEATLHSGPPDNEGRSSLKYAQLGGEDFTILCSTVDETIHRGTIARPTMIKLDVEGWELAVLKGAETLFAQYPPRRVVFEAAAKSDGTLDDESLRDFFESRNYRITHLTRAYGKVENVENFRAERIRPLAT